MLQRKRSAVEGNVNVKESAMDIYSATTVFEDVLFIP